VVTWKRVLDDFTLTVDELGGRADAVGIVSFFAFMQGDAVDVVDTDGALVLKERQGMPVHQYTQGASRPR